MAELRKLAEKYPPKLPPVDPHRDSEPSWRGDGWRPIGRP